MNYLKVGNVIQRDVQWVGSQVIKTNSDKSALYVQTAVWAWNHADAHAYSCTNDKVATREICSHWSLIDYHSFTLYH